MNRTYCFAFFALMIVFAITVAPLIAEAGESESLVAAPSGVRETWQERVPANGLTQPDSFGAEWGQALARMFSCGLLGFVEFAFTGCLLTCLIPSRPRRTRV